MENIIEKHRELLYPCVRVRAGNVGGSGTVVYSKPHDKKKEEYETFVLTNHHVVEGHIRIEEKWSTLLQRNVKSDTKSTVEVEFFKYRWESRSVGGTRIDADIVCYDRDQDIALLRLKDNVKIQYVAKMYPLNKEKELYIFKPVYAVGAALGHSPVVTGGHISGFDDEIDNYEFWLSTAPTIFGNSGGAIFLQETNEFIGIPSRIAVILIGFGADAITHMSYFIPITRIYKFIEEQVFNFIFDDRYTSSQCEELRKKKREEEELRLARREVKDNKSED